MSTSATWVPQPEEGGCRCIARVFVRSIEPTIAIATITRRPWNSVPATWKGYTADFGAIDYPLSAGRSLVLKLVVDGVASDDDMWFAFGSSGPVNKRTIKAAPAAGPPVLIH